VSSSGAGVGHHGELVLVGTRHTELGGQTVTGVALNNELLYKIHWTSRLYEQNSP
jgi:hypothetical protein